MEVQKDGASTKDTEQLFGQAIPHYKRITEDSLHLKLVVSTSIQILNQIWHWWRLPLHFWRVESDENILKDESTLTTSLKGPYAGQFTAKIYVKVHDLRNEISQSCELACIGSFWRIPGARRLQSCWKTVEESVVGATNKQAWVQSSSALLLSWLCCFHLCARCPIMCLTRLDLFNKVYRRRKLHG